MYTYKEQLEVLKNIHLREGQTRRINCPFCGGKSTFTITRSDSSKVWNCYKASCGTKGGHDTERSREAIRRGIAGKEGPRYSKAKPLPAHVSALHNHPHVLTYMRINHVHDAHKEGLINLAYEPVSNRILFYMNNGDGAVGRALGNSKPKWQEYGETSGILTVGEGNIGVIVEDAASACAVGVVDNLVGCAILGTQLSTLQKQQLREFDKLIVALDADASRNALRLRDKLLGRTDTSVVVLQDDLKYSAPNQVRELLCPERS